ncbi:hypothetical protein EJ06DRAFT_431533 [Trichodelitschia bisporula]|uniref:Uncharacterized protein n=1 Tax=Trichodelitschia bisporula TaxID=703511 RepID=A0A6G1HWS6_9PEZI|nr:hypothetical protein EJ06DRAFT_431533 [Trichodelitschia bisporula]
MMRSALTGKISHYCHLVSVVRCTSQPNHRANSPMRRSHPTPLGPQSPAVAAAQHRATFNLTSILSPDSCSTAACQPPNPHGKHRSRSLRAHVAPPLTLKWLSTLICGYLSTWGARTYSAWRHAVDEMCEIPIVALAPHISFTVATTRQFPSIAHR